MDKIKLGIIGYGNLGKGLERNIKDNDDLDLVGIFSRRDPKFLDTSSPAYRYDQIKEFKGKIDVMILAGSSKNDIMDQAYEIAKDFNTVDAFDTHNLIPEYFNKLDKINKDNNTLSLISTGWDPGLFSLNRAISEAILPMGESYTFWGKGVSQGHSEAIRALDGVEDAVQYTIPQEENIEKIRQGESPLLSTRQKHKRQCFVVAEDGADKEKIREEIVTMKNYFEDYDTEVNFISHKELRENHSGIPHGGTVIRNGKTGQDNRQIYEFTLKLDSNPEFTSAVMIAYARAIYTMSKENISGTMTILDIPISKLLRLSKDEQLKLI